MKPSPHPDKKKISPNSTLLLYRFLSVNAVSGLHGFGTVKHNPSLKKKKTKQSARTDHEPSNKILNLMDYFIEGFLRTY